jgi:hypothetical protein
MNHGLRLALEMLADAGEQGSTDVWFFSRFTPEIIDLLESGLATAEREVMRRNGRRHEIVRVRITDEGRRAIGGRSEFNRH